MLNVDDLFVILQHIDIAKETLGRGDSFLEVVSDFTIVPTLSCQERIAQRRSRQRGMRHSAAA